MVNTRRDNPPMPTSPDIQEARTVYQENEPRDLFYRVAMELMDRSIEGATEFSVIEAAAVLLQTWNKRYYNKHRPFNRQHFSDIERIVNQYQTILIDLRERSIKNCSAQDETIIKEIFRNFTEVVGPVGAAKGLHLFAPHFFPLWDSAIAEEYGFYLKYGDDPDRHTANANNYYNFMMITKKQCQALTEEFPGENVLKRIDEYNYTKITLKRMQERNNS